MIHLSHSGELRSAALCRIRPLREIGQIRLVAAVLCLAAFPAFALNAGLGEPPPEVQRETPLATVQGFLDAAHAGHYGLAAHYLDLDFIRRSVQPEEGARLARRFKFVLDRKQPIDPSKVSSDPNGEPSDPFFDQLGLLPLEKGNLPIRVTRRESSAGPVWVFSEETVRGIDRAYDLYGPPLGESLPPWMFRGAWLGIEPWQWIGLGVVLLLAFSLSLLAEKVLLAVGISVARLTAFTWDDALIHSGKGPLKLPFASMLLAAGSRFLLIPTPVQSLFDLVARTLIIVSVAWFLLRFIKRVGAQMQSRVAQEGDALHLRGLHTQLTVLQRVLEIAIYAVAIALLLMQFEVVRHLGVSLLASAGIAGLVVGLAAQKSISVLLAGIQLSITQPIRIGDTVVLEGETGTVEEITLTYVVVRIWDFRRLVVPVTYFLDKPFQNWSKRAPDLLGTVHLRLDFRADVEEIRKETDRLLRTELQSLWDGKKVKVHVTDADDRTMTLRVLVSAKDPDNSFDLRTALREQLLGYIRNHPDWLPIQRMGSLPSQLDRENPTE